MPTTSTSLFLKLLKENGMSQSDVNLTQVALGSEPGPFLAGQAKVAVMYEPGLDQVAAKGMKVVLGFPQKYGPYAFSAVSARKDVDPAIAQAFVTGMQAAIRLMQAEPAKAVSVAKREFPTLDPTVVEAAVKRMMAEKVYPENVDITPEALTIALDTQIALGNLAAQPSMPASCGGTSSPRRCRELRTGPRHHDDARTRACRGRRAIAPDGSTHSPTPPPCMTGRDGSTRPSVRSRSWRSRSHRRSVPRRPLGRHPGGGEGHHRHRDLPTANGSPIDEGRVPAADAWVVSRLRDLGASVLGKTVTTEFAWRQPGPTHNPWARGHAGRLVERVGRRRRGRARAAGARQPRPTAR